MKDQERSVHSEGIKNFRTLKISEILFQRTLIFGILLAILWGFADGNFINLDWASLSFWIPLAFTLIFIIYRYSSLSLGINLLFIITLALIHFRYWTTQSSDILFLTCFIIIGGAIVGKFILPLTLSALQFIMVAIYYILGRFDNMRLFFILFMAFLPTLFLSYLINQILKKQFEITHNQNLVLKTTQNKLIEQKKVETIANMAGGIAHDFNNILTSLLGDIELLKLDDKLSIESENLIKDAEISAIRARDLTQKLLTFSKSGIPLKKEVVQLPTILKVLGNFGLVGTPIIFELEFDPFLKNIKGDSSHIMQIFQNLILNARDAIRTEGKIRVTATNRSWSELPEKAKDKLGSSKNNDYLEINITDTGCGIKPQDFPHIFDPYHTSKVNGTGLGLIITQSLISLHEGCIFVESELDKGTTVKVFLPATDEHEQKLPANAENSPIASKKILIMDDEPTIQVTLGKMLEKLGHKSDTCENGETCIQKYMDAAESGQSYDLVILDMVIPGGMGGKEAMQNLLRLDPDTLGIMTSGYTSHDHLSKYREYGFRTLLLKPYTFLELEKAIWTALEN